MTTTETKPTDTPAKPDGKVEDKSLVNKDATKPVVPDKYEFKAPEGFEIDAKFVADATPVLKELGLDQAQAQKLVDLYSKKAQEQAEAPYKAYEDIRSTWRKDILSDTTLSNGSELKPEVKATISAALDSLGDAKLTSDFKAAMDLTGAGDNPAFVRAFYKLAQMLPREGALVLGGKPSPLGQRAPGAKPVSAAAAMYPNLPTSSQG